MAPIEIRPFREADQSSVVALWTAVFGYSAAHNDPLEIIGHKLALQRELFFVAVHEGIIVGTVMGGYDGLAHKSPVAQKRQRLPRKSDDTPMTGRR